MNNRPREKRKKPIKRRRDGYTGKRKAKLKDFAVTKGKSKCKKKIIKCTLKERKTGLMSLNDLKALMKEKFGTVK